MIVTLVLLSAFLHALWNALLRLEESKDRSLVLAIGVATVFAATVAAGRRLGGEVLFETAAGVGFTVLAGVMEAAYFATLARAMELGTLGMVYTISRGGAVLAVWPLSIALFGEAATATSIGGSVLVLAGLATSGLGADRARRQVDAAHGSAAARSRSDDRRAGDDGDGGSGGARRANQRAAIGSAAACAVAIAGYHLAYAAALREATNPSACFALSLAVSVAINGTRLARGNGRALLALLRRRWPRLLVMGLVSGGSFLILIEALARGDAGYVLTLRNTSVLFALAMSWRIGERPRGTDIAGAVLVAAGAALLAL